jgi:hypothetical protein
MFKFRSALEARIGFVWKVLTHSDPRFVEGRKISLNPKGRKHFLNGAGKRSHNFFEMVGEEGLEPSFSFPIMHFPVRSRCQYTPVNHGRLNDGTRIQIPPFSYTVDGQN